MCQCLSLPPLSLSFRSQVWVLAKFLVDFITSTIFSRKSTFHFSSANLFARLRLWSLALQDQPIKWKFCIVIVLWIREFGSRFHPRRPAPPPYQPIFIRFGSSDLVQISYPYRSLVSFLIYSECCDQFFHLPARPTKIDQKWKFLTSVFLGRFGWNLVWALIMVQKQHRISLKYLRPIFYKKLAVFKKFIKDEGKYGTNSWGFKIYENGEHNLAAAIILHT